MKQQATQMPSREAPPPFHTLRVPEYLRPLIGALGLLAVNGRGESPTPPIGNPSLGSQPLGLPSRAFVNFDRPDLVIVYGPDMKPGYVELLKVKALCEQHGQTVTLIPPPNATNDGPLYPVEEQTAAQIKDALSMLPSDRLFTLYLYTHGTVKESEHYSTLGRSTMATRAIIQLSLENSNVVGIYDASCFSGATLFQVEDELSRVSVPRVFQFAADSPPHKEAKMSDSAALLQELPALALKGLPITPETLHQHYLISLGDTGDTSASPWLKEYPPRYGSSDSSQETLSYNDPEKKLDRLLSTYQKGAVTIPMPVTSHIGEEATKALTELLSQGTSKTELRERKLSGEAMILADALYPGENATLDKRHLVALGMQTAEFAEHFASLPENLQRDFTKRFPDHVIANADYLRSAMQRNANLALEMIKGALEENPTVFNPRRDSKTLASAYPTVSAIGEFIKRTDPSERFYAWHELRPLMTELKRLGASDPQIGQILKPYAQRVMIGNLTYLKPFYSKEKFSELIRIVVAEHLSDSLFAEALFDAIDDIAPYLSQGELKSILDRGLKIASHDAQLHCVAALAGNYSNQAHIDELFNTVITSYSSKTDTGMILSHAEFLSRYPQATSLVCEAVQSALSSEARLSFDIRSVAWAFDDPNRLEDLLVNFVQRVGGADSDVWRVRSLFGSSQALFETLVTYGSPFDFALLFDDLSLYGFSEEEITAAAKAMIPKLIDKDPTSLFDNPYTDSIPRILARAGIDPVVARQEAAQAIARTLGDPNRQETRGIELWDVFENRTTWLGYVPEGERRGALLSLYGALARGALAEALLREWDTITPTLEAHECEALLAQAHRSAVERRDAPLLVEYCDILRDVEGFDPVTSANRLCGAVHETDSIAAERLLYLAPAIAEYADSGSAKVAFERAVHQKPLSAFLNPQWMRAYIEVGGTVEEVQQTLLWAATSNALDSSPWTDVGWYRELIAISGDPKNVVDHYAREVLERLIKYLPEDARDEERNLFLSRLNSIK